MRVGNLVAVGVILLLSCGMATANSVSIYVDAAPNVYGSPNYPTWEAATFAAVANGTFVNMSNGVNPANVGTTNFEIQDEVVYSFGDLGLRLTWIYWIPQTSISELVGNFKIALYNVWGSDPELDFYDYYYSSTWLEPTKWVEYSGGVIGTAGMAWWGAYGVNTQEALDQDIAAWRTVDETWTFKAQLDNQTTELVSSRSAVPEPLTMAGVFMGVAGLAGYIRKRRMA